MELGRRLERCESPNVTFIGDDSPIFWQEALGANVLDVDGNLYIDLTGAFGVAAAGHRNARVADAIRLQLDRLLHGMGDVHPPEIKVRLLERLAEVAPGDLGHAILTTSGAEAVEAALKTARLATDRPGVLCFTGAYHGLTYGALAVTDGQRFRAPFRDQFGIPVARASYPRPEADPDGVLALAAVRERLDAPEGDRIGAVIIEPIQVRGGVIVPPSGFLSNLHAECRRRGRLLILDEVYTGFGRTGRWFASEHDAVVPDLLCVGKALTGGLPFSACLGRPEVMAAWPPSRGEAMHTSTFLGHPLGCAAALAQMDEIRERDLLNRAATLGARTLDRLAAFVDRYPAAGAARGRGLLAGLQVVRPSAANEPDPEAARRVVIAALRAGVLLLAGGTDGSVLTLSPPLTIEERQLDHALDVVEDCLART